MKESNKKIGRPRSVEIRRYNKNDNGTRVFNLEDIEAEMELQLLPGRRGNLYVGTEYENHKFIVLVERKKEDTLHLEQIVRNWNPEHDNVEVLKIAFEQFGNVLHEMENNPSLSEALVHMEVAEEFEDKFNELRTGEQMIWTCDYNGNCLIDNGNIKHISEF